MNKIPILQFFFSRFSFFFSTPVDVRRFALGGSCRPYEWKHERVENEFAKFYWKRKVHLELPRYEAWHFVTGFRQFDFVCFPCVPACFGSLLLPIIHGLLATKIRRLQSRMKWYDGALFSSTKSIFSHNFSRNVNVTIVIS